MSLITSYDAATAGNVVNQVQWVYNGLGQLTAEYQSHNGLVNMGQPNPTPVVQYAYTEMANGVNNSRLTTITYPSGYQVDYNYDAGLDSNISRLTSLKEHGTGITLESYKYLGLDTVVERDHPQNGVNLTYIKQGSDPNANGDGGDQYTGLDRFGRVIDQNWVNTTTTQPTDRFQMGYDQDSNVLYRQNLVDTLMMHDELYQYDQLNQLVNFQRGKLNATHNAIVGTPTRSQSWSPDALGNFTSVTSANNGTSTTQTRTHDQQNEITSLSDAGSAPTYDHNGNLTSDGVGNSYVYDAWNRLVQVTNGSGTLATYGYDGLGRRITETHGSTMTDLYYSADWQVLEERVNGQLQARYVWSPAGVDTLALRDDSSQNNGVLDRRLYVQQDAIGNVTALVDTTGNVVERYVYDPYGAVTVLDQNFMARGTSNYGWLYFFQGKRYDGVVGLYDSRYRVYSPTLMRPLQTDPTGQAAGVNPYCWEGNGPIGRIDPNGEFWQGFVIAAIIAGYYAFGPGASESQAPTQPNEHVIIPPQTRIGDDIVAGVPGAIFTGGAATGVVSPGRAAIWAIGSGAFDLGHQGMGNVDDWWNDRPPRGYDPLETGESMMIGSLLGPVAGKYPASRFPIGGLGILAGANAMLRGDTAQGTFDAVTGAWICSGRGLPIPGRGSSRSASGRQRILIDLVEEPANAPTRGGKLFGLREWEVAPGQQAKAAKSLQQLEADYVKATGRRPVVLDADHRQGALGYIDPKTGHIELYSGERFGPTARAEELFHYQQLKARGLLGKTEAEIGPKVIQEIEAEVEGLLRNAGFQPKR